MTRVSFRALIPCGKPKSNDNGKLKREEIEGGRKERRLEFFTWFDYVSLHPQDVVNGLYLY